MAGSDAFPGWCAICRRVALGALTVGVLVNVAPHESAPAAAPTVIRFASDAVGTGLDHPGRVVQDLPRQQRSLAVLQAREQARRTPAPAVTPTLTTAPSPVTVPVGVGPTLGGQLPPSAPQAVTVAIRYALAQVGKPYVWGATGPDTYDCSGLVQRSYAMAGVSLPRTSREQARVGTPVELADLLPGDLLFWAYNPGDLSTVHHVAMYLGDGKIVQAPQPGEYVEVTGLWLSGYAGAVRVASGPADTPLPAVPAAVPGTGLTPAGDAMPDGSPPPDDGSLPPTTLVPGARPGGSVAGLPPGTTAPGTTAPGTTAPGTTAPGTTAPGSTTPGTTAPGTTAPGATAPGTTAPGTTAPGSSAPGTIAPGTNPPTTTAPGTTAPGTTPPGTTAPGTTAPGTNPPSGTGSAGTTAPGTTAPATTPPATPPPDSTPPESTPAETSSAPPTTPPPAPESTSPAAAATASAAATNAAPSSPAPSSPAPTATPTATP
ncbi:MAG TPA: NlpC/P60 family protein [Mycobacteriales bacterium]|nr:NlpC/P60 family protein [Mycobacteriales bacterium]